jgi:hypothetical protein
MVEITVIERKLKELDRYLQQLSRYQGITGEELRQDLEKAWAVEHGLQLCIQILLDVGNHLLSGKGNLRKALGVLPHYTDEGLMYGDKKEEITRQEFEHRFIGSLVSTAISGEGTAKGGSLHEIEFINNKFRDGDGKLRDVRIAGCIWIKRDTSIDGKSVVVNDEGVVIGKFNAIQELILGGESKYGFGHVVLDSINRIQFPVNEKMEKDKITLDVKEEEALIAHLRYDKSIRFKGDIELLTGRGYFDPENSKSASDRPGRIIPQPQFYFSPGTVLTEGRTLVVNWDGTAEAEAKATS